MHILAPAKINLGLNILRQRPDGFHDIDSLMVKLNIFDELLIEKADELSLEVIGPHLPLDFPKDSRNLVYQAAEIYLKALGYQAGAKMILKKVLPTAAGLGGGSSDAASTLKALKQIYPSDQDLFALAQQLGSDVSFFVSEMRSARAQGRGEILDPVALPKLHIILVNPHVAVSAKEAYGALKAYQEALNVEDLRASLVDEPRYQNGLEAGVIKLYPTIAEVLDVLRGEGLKGVRMSGSGSSCFALAADALQAKHALNHIQKLKPHWWAVYTQNLS
ncbi:MAG: 4-(cytidine 5'-diphospho)-2-C-methyl-D-erythritol kinase [Deinococcales bacterium]